ncbi:TlpA disulfide reductase family protein [Telluribacter sp. SYSU D00476]|uniref:TlpA family protein disulfide reductase n=1 Tax=Telluribacter sp. SYSU D00476 TaxID=2811430 RepID=UPI001FF266C6|nr:TlpA disulfide reductase family protein [Telluribacter sp. SYSU D00476]
MMKTLLGLAIAGWLVFPTTTRAQDISLTDVLNKVNQAVLQLDQCQFTFHNRIAKHVADDDSSYTEYTTKCFFKKTPGDSVMNYQVASFRKDGYHQQIYDGNNLFTVIGETLEVTGKQTYSGRIKEQLENSEPTYLINTNRALQDFNLPSSAQYIRNLLLDHFLGEKCYKLTVDYPGDSLRTSKVSYYISAKSFLPIRTVITLTSIVGKVKETQIFDQSIRGMKSAPLEVNQFSREKLSNYRIEKNYDPSEEYAKDELLPIGSPAPNWKLPLISGDTLALADLRGKIVIMDFWFKACAPCQQQMISLQAFHEKFPSNEVAFVGVNTIDDPKKDRLEMFLKNRLISMPSVYKGKSIQPLYNVHGSPALFIIDKQGMIVYTVSGYLSKTGSEVEQIILKHLKQ